MRDKNATYGQGPLRPLYTVKAGHGLVVLKSTKGYYHRDWFRLYLDFDDMTADCYGRHPSDNWTGELEFEVFA